MTNLPPESPLSSKEWSDFFRHPKARRELTRELFFVFWWWYFDHIHKRQIPDYKDPVFAAARDPRVLLIEPRDHGKSAPWSRGYPLWIALTNPFNLDAIPLSNGAFRYAPGCEEVISQISCAGDLPEKWMRFHRNELRYNVKLIDDWGTQSTAGLEGGIWSADEILLKNGAHLYSKGTGAQIRGDHPKRIIVDDLEDRKRVENPELRDKDIEYFFSDLYGAAEPDTTMFVLGTILHPESLLQKLWERDPAQIMGLTGEAAKREKWTKFRFEARLPDGSPLNPIMWPADALDAREATLRAFKPSIWYREYLNRPESSEAPVFPSAWFNPELNGYLMHSPEFKQTIAPDLRHVSFCDPNAGEKEINDFTAIATLGFKPAENCLIYFRQGQLFRGTPEHKIRTAVNTWVQWRGLIGFEGIAFQSWIKPIFDKVCQQDFYNPNSYTTNYRDRPVKGEPTPKQIDKVTRAGKIVYLFEENRIRFDYTDPMTVRFIEQLKMFPTGSYDDAVDAIVGALWEIHRILEELKFASRGPSLRSYDPDTGEPI